MKVVRVQLWTKGHCVKIYLHNRHSVLVSTEYLFWSSLGLWVELKQGILGVATACSICALWKIPHAGKLKLAINLLLILDFFFFCNF